MRITVNRDNKEYVDNGGVWNVFFDGKKITSVNGDVASTQELLKLLKEKSPSEIHEHFKTNSGKNGE